MGSMKRHLLAIAAFSIAAALAGCGGSAGSSSPATQGPARLKEAKGAIEKEVAAKQPSQEVPKEKPAKKATPENGAKEKAAQKEESPKKVETVPIPKVVAPPTERFLLFTPLNPFVVEVELTIDGQPHAVAMDKLVEEVVKLADTDGDGRPTWKEVTASKRFMYGQFGNLAISGDNGIKQILELYDTDRDGAVDRGEVPRFLTRNAGGARVFSIRGTSDFRDTNRFDSPLWNLLNTDDDRHSISAAEMAAAPARLRSRDTDDDDVVVPSDLAIAGPTQPGELPARRRVRGPDAARLMGSGAHWDMIRVTLDEQYALGGNLTAGSFPLTPKLFEQLDTDKSGRMLKAEYQLLDKIPAHIRLAINFGKPAKAAKESNEPQPPAGAPLPEGQAQIRLAGLSEELESVEHSVIEQPGRLTLNIGGMTLTFYTNDTVAAADFEAQAKQALEMFDADKNGYLEAKEVPENAQAAFGRIEAVDTDEDGKVYPGEIVNFLSQQQAALRAQIHAKAEDREDAFFLALDENGDERLDGREIENAPARLKLFDRNGDGEVIGDEIPPAMVVGFSRGSLQNLDALFAIPSLIARAPAKDIPRWFTLMDTSGDGVLSRREFLGTAEQFIKLDANQDGFLDAVEIKAAMPD